MESFLMLTFAKCVRFFRYILDASTLEIQKFFINLITIEYFMQIAFLYLGPMKILMNFFKQMQQEFWFPFVSEEKLNFADLCVCHFNKVID